MHFGSKCNLLLYLWRKSHDTFKYILKFIRGVTCMLKSVVTTNLKRCLTNRSINPRVNSPPPFGSSNVSLLINWAVTIKDINKCLLRTSFICKYCTAPFDQLIRLTVTYVKGKLNWNYQVLWAHIFHLIT